MDDVQTANLPRQGRRFALIATLLLAALALIAALAPAAQATSPYTAFCDVAEATEFCPAGHVYSQGTTIEAVSDHVLIGSNAFNTECDEATAAFRTKASAGEPLATELTAFSLSGCSYGGFENCELTTKGLNEPFQPTFSATGSGYAAVQGTSVSWHEVCLTESWSELDLGTFHVEGNGATLYNGQLTFDHAKISCTGNCPPGAELTTTLDVVSAEPIYISRVNQITEPAMETTFCQWKQTFCPTSQRYASGTTLEASLKGGPLAISNSLQPVECSSSTLKAASTATGAAALGLSVTTFSVGGCSGKGVSCKTETVSGSTSGSLSWSSDTSGTWSLTSPGLKFHLTCNEETGSHNITLYCTFKLAEGAALNVSGGSPAHVEANVQPGKEGSLCPKKSTLTADYTITSPNPLYVARN